MKEFNTLITMKLDVQYLFNHLSDEQKLDFLIENAGSVPLEAVANRCSFADLQKFIAKVAPRMGYVRCQITEPPKTTRKKKDAQHQE